jgi:DNA-binding NtrC family response regulator
MRLPSHSTQPLAGTLNEAPSAAPGSETHPSLADLAESIFFSLEDGQIWLNNQRVVLMQCSALGAMRRELIDHLGLMKARGVLTRMGYNCGVRDAEFVRSQWPGADPVPLFLAGAKLHGLEGLVKVEPVRLAFDAGRGAYSGEFIWHNSSEADEVLRVEGVGSEPACWSLLGYATGYVSTLLGKLIVFREVECRAQGASVCRVIGRPAEEWPDVEEDLQHLNAEPFVSISAYKVPQAKVPAALPGVDPVAGSEDEPMVGVSPSFNSACRMLRKVAPTRSTVLFTGESGVGKELFARMLHGISPRRGRPLVSINCAAIPDALLESELFGVERGAFTGATASRPGRFERANGGTLFLDEIGNLSLSSQGKLLRALQEGVVERVGGTSEIRVDVRVVAATNVDLRCAIREGRFREDLYFRLNVFPIHLPPLRERREDIPLLVSCFLGRYNALHGRNVPGFTARALRVLLDYGFPGNIRELQNLVERGVIAAEEDELIDLSHIFRDEPVQRSEGYSVASGGALAQRPRSPEAAATEPPSASAQPQAGRRLSMADLDALGNRLMEEAIARARGNLSAAARDLGLSRRQLEYRLKKNASAAPGTGWAGERG